MRRTFRNEGHVKEAVKTLIQKYDGWYFMPSMNGFGRQGIPDFVCCINGRFLAIETKFGNNKPTEHQQKELKSITAKSGVAFVVNEKNLEVLETLLKAICREPR